MCAVGSPHKPFECRAGVQADLVVLVDGSWSIGRTNFKKVREFLEGLVTPFHVGPYGVQIGKLSQASRSFRVFDSHLNFMDLSFLNTFLLMVILIMFKYL